MSGIHTHKAMNTEFSIRFDSKDDPNLVEGAIAAAFAKIDDIERILSRFNDSSDTALIASLHPGEVATVTPTMMSALLSCVEVCAATGGAFDPTLAPVMDLLRDKKMAWGEIKEEEIEDAFARCGMKRLVLDTENMRVSVTEDKLGRPTPLLLDFGGIGKGIALDECRELLSSECYEVSNFIIDAGSSTILASGEKEWKIGVGGPWKKRTRLETAITLSNGILSGSGFELQGEHIINPLSHNAASEWAHVWVYTTKSAAIADALSTAAFSLTKDELKLAGKALESDILVARKQPLFADRFRDPLKWIRANES
jgi:thiamine biosynthesis lipoprotein